MSILCFAESIFPQKCSFVADTLKSVGKNMRTKEVDEDHVEEHVGRYSKEQKSS